MAGIRDTEATFEVNVSGIGKLQELSSAGDKAVSALRKLDEIANRSIQFHGSSSVNKITEGIEKAITASEKLHESMGKGTGSSSKAAESMAKIAEASAKAQQQVQKVAEAQTKSAEASARTVEGINRETAALKESAAAAKELANARKRASEADTSQHSSGGNGGYHGNSSTRSASEHSSGGKIREAIREGLSLYSPGMMLASGITRGAEGFKELLGKGMEYNSEQSGMHATWTTLTDGARDEGIGAKQAGNAPDIVQSISSMSRDNGRGLDLVNEGYQQIYHATEDIGRTKHMMQSQLRIGDAMGLTEAQASRFTMYGVGHAMDKGVVQGGNLNQMAMYAPAINGALARAYLAKQQGKDIKDVDEHEAEDTKKNLRALARKGQLSSEMLENALNYLGDTKFKDAAENAQKSIPGMVRSIENGAPRLVGKFEQGFLEPLAKATSSSFGKLTKWINSDESDKWAESVGRSLSNVTVKFTDFAFKVGNKAKELWDGSKSFREGFGKGFIDEMGKIAGAVGDAGNFIAGIYKKVTGMLPKKGDGVAGDIGETLGKVVAVIAALKGASKLPIIGDVFGGILDKLGGFVGKIPLIGSTLERIIGGNKFKNETAANTMMTASERMLAAANMMNGGSAADALDGLDGGGGKRSKMNGKSAVYRKDGKYTRAERFANSRMGQRFDERAVKYARQGERGGFRGLLGRGKGRVNARTGAIMMGGAKFLDRAGGTTVGRGAGAVLRGGRSIMRRGGGWANAAFAGLDIYDAYKTTKENSNERHEKIGSAVGAGVGATVGGAVGSLIPIPVVGTLIGSVIGGFIGDKVGGFIGQHWNEATEKFRDIQNTMQKTGEKWSESSNILQKGAGEYLKYAAHPIEYMQGVQNKLDNKGKDWEKSDNVFVKGAGYATRFAMHPIDRSVEALQNGQNWMDKKGTEFSHSNNGFVKFGGNAMRFMAHPIDRGGEAIGAARGWMDKKAGEWKKGNALQQWGAGALDTINHPLDALSNTWNGFTKKAGSQIDGLFNMFDLDPKKNTFTKMFDGFKGFKMPDFGKMFGGLTGFKMPDLSKMFGGMSNFKLPDLSKMFGGLSNFKLPDLSKMFGGLSNFKLPDFSKMFSGFKLPDFGKMLNFKWPKFNFPKFSWPKINFPKFSWPKFNLPKFSWPKFNFPKFSWPKFDIPKFSWPKFDMPKFSWPKFNFPKFSWPKFDFPKFSWPKFEMPKFSWPELKAPGWLSKVGDWFGGGSSGGGSKSGGGSSGGGGSSKSSGGGFWSGLKNGATSAWNSVKSTADSGWNKVKSGASSAWNGVKSVSSNGGKAIGNSFNSVASGAKNAFSKLGDNLKGGINKASSAAKDVGKKLGDSLKFKNIGNDAKNAFSKVGDSIKSGLNKAKSTATSSGKGIESALKSSFSKVGNIGKDSFSKLSDGVKSGLNKAKSSATSGAKGISTAVTSGLKGVANASKSAMNGFGNAVTSGLNKGVSAARSGASKIVSSLQSGLSKVGTVATSGFDKMSSSMTSAMSKVSTAATSGMSKVGTAVSSGMDKVATAVESGANKAVASLTGAFNKMASAGASAAGKVASSMSQIGASASSATGQVQALANAINSLHSKTVTITANVVGKGADKLATGTQGAYSAFASAIPRYASGSSGGHQGGAALVNDEKGDNYREAFLTPSGALGVFPAVRNLLLDLPRGTHVLKASDTRRMFGNQIEKYADGTNNAMEAVVANSNRDTSKLKPTPSKSKGSSFSPTVNININVSGDSSNATDIASAVKAQVKQVMEDMYRNFNNKTEEVTA